MQNISLTEKSDRHERLTKNCSKQICRLRKEFLIHASPRNNKRIQTIKSKTKTKSIISIISKTKTKKKSIIKKTRREREKGVVRRRRFEGCQGTFLDARVRYCFPLPLSLSFPSQRLHFERMNGISEEAS